MASRKNIIRVLKVAAFVAGTATIASCNDYHYDPAYVQAVLDYNWSQKIGEIDSLQNWSMAEQAKANMAVYGVDALSDYKLKLYTDNPLANPEAKLVASVPVTTDEIGSAAVQLDVDILKGQTTFCACYEDKDLRRNYKPVALINGEIDAIFGDKPTRASSSSDGLVIPEKSSPADEVNAKKSLARNVSWANVDQNWTDSPDYASVLIINEADTWDGTISVLGSNGNLARTLYVDGTWKVNGYQQLGGGGLIVVGANGKIDIPSGSSLISDNSGRIVVLKGGQITGQGALTFANGSTGTFDYNAGTIDVGTLNNNGGEMYNYGTLKTNELQGGAGLSVYVNHGTMTIDHSTYGSTSANTRIFNACQLEVTQNLCCKIIKMGSSSYASIGGNLLMSGSWDGTSDAAEIVMASASLIRVAGGVALNYASIVGPLTGANAVCEFGQIGDPNNQVATNFTTNTIDGKEQITDGYVINNLSISIDKTETIDNYWNLTPYGKFYMCMLNGRLYDVAQINGDASNNWQTTYFPVYREGVMVGNGQAAIVSKGQANVNIPSGCGAAYVPEQGREDQAEPQSFIFACEDLGTSDDFDFNDVVFEVSHAAGTNKVNVEVLAAGGTLTLELVYIDASGNEIAIGEAHRLLGAEDGVMTNTEEIDHHQSAPVTIDVENGWSLASNYTRFKVKVSTVQGATGGVVVTSPNEGRGKAPQIIIVPGGWEWPLERVNITEAYPGFVNWSKNASLSSWNQSKDPDMIVPRSNVATRSR